jgi:hypothetical protein
LDTDDRAVCDFRRAGRLRCAARRIEVERRRPICGVVAFCTESLVLPQPGAQPISRTGTFCTESLVRPQPGAQPISRAGTFYTESLVHLQSGAKPISGHQPSGSGKSFSARASVPRRQPT